MSSASRRRRRRAPACGLLVAATVLIVVAPASATTSIGVSGQVAPSKLAQDAFRPVSLTTSLATSWDQLPPEYDPILESESVSFGRNVAFDLSDSRACKLWLLRDSTAEAIERCPESSLIGKGTAMWGSIAMAVSVFHGPAPRGVRFHLAPADQQNDDGYSRLLLDSTLSKGSKAFPNVLTIEHVRNFEEAQVSELSFTVPRKSGVALASCQTSRFRWQADLTLSDGSTAADETDQKCRVR